MGWNERPFKHSRLVGQKQSISSLQTLAGNWTLSQRWEQFLEEVRRTDLCLVVAKDACDEARHSVPSSAPLPNVVKG